MSPKPNHGDVWLVTDRDENMRIEGGPGDLVVVRLPEHSGSGYLCVSSRSTANLWLSSRTGAKKRMQAAWAVQRFAA